MKEGERGRRKEEETGHYDKEQKQNRVLRDKTIQSK